MGRFTVVALVALCLFAPSIWMLATISPLWKDCDAYLQVTSPPESGIPLHYAPLSCYLPRLSLYAGYAFEILRAGSSLPSFTAFFLQPVLSDAGVRLLIVLQHAALCASGSFLIFSATRLIAARLVLALLWAANPLFYVWAHCVGSEAISLILVLLLAATGFRLVRRSGKIRLSSWLTFGLLLALSMLTRHINGILAALLPLAFGFVGFAYFVRAFRQQPPRKQRWLRSRGGRAMRNAFAAIAVGVLCIVSANVTLRVLAQAAGLRNHTTAGFTFMFRLGFLAPLSSEKRERLIQEAVERSKSEDVRTLLNVFRDAPSPAQHFQTMALLAKARAALRPEEADSLGKFLEVMNLTARSFLTPPSPELLNAARKDFSKGLRQSMRGLVMRPFVHTTYFFRHPGSMAQCASLTTFRDKSSTEIPGQIRAHPYLRVGKHVILNGLLWLCGAGFVLVAIFGRRGAVPIAAYVLALTLVGLLILFATCLLDDFQGRFTLPLWELTIVGVTVLVGSAAESLHFALRKRKARRAAGAAG